MNENLYKGIKLTTHFKNEEKPILNLELGFRNVDALLAVPDREEVPMTNGNK